MPYTLMKGLVWVLLAVLLGIVIGWLLRDVTARRQIARARGRSAKPDDTEIERLRARVANLEPIVNERDRLRHELDDANARAAAAEESARSASPSASCESAGVQPFAATQVESAAAPAEPAVDVSVEPDISGAAAVLGSSIKLNDLTVIEGIGPKIAELCGGIGIGTWAELAATEVSLLRTMLTDAGQRFKAHDPSTWPRQAGMLASGAWQEFQAYTDELDGGREVT